MVNGLVYNVVNAATGKLTRSSTASSTAEIICNGPGIRPQNKPIATPPATERRCRCHRLGWCNQPPNGLSQRWLFTVSWRGRNLRKNLRMASFYQPPRLPNSINPKNSLEPNPSQPPLVREGASFALPLT